MIQEVSIKLSLKVSIEKEGKTANLSSSSLITIPIFSKVYWLLSVSSDLSVQKLTPLIFKNTDGCRG